LYLLLFGTFLLEESEDLCWGKLIFI